ncbi:MAG: hypothetical protein RSG59_04905 [Ruthenibacterium sp.]
MPKEKQFIFASNRCKNGLLLFWCCQSGSQRSGEQSDQKLFLAQRQSSSRKGIYSVQKHIRPHRRTRKFIYANRKLTILRIAQDGQLFIFTVFAYLFSFSDSAAASLAIHLALATQRHHFAGILFSR